MENNISTAAALMGSSKSEAKAKAARENGKKGGRPSGTIALLFRNDGKWWLGTYKGDTIPSKNFETAKAARDFAASKQWGIKRAPDCDA